MYSGVPIITPAPVILFPESDRAIPKVHDPGLSVLVDHDVLGLEVSVDDPQPVRFLKALTYLPGDADRPSRGSAGRPSG